MIIAQAEKYIFFLNVNLRMFGHAGYKPRYKEWQRGGAAGPRRVVESRSQNQGPSGASREGCVSQPVHSALCNADQVFQTGTACGVYLHIMRLSVDSVKVASLRGKRRNGNFEA